MNRAREWLEKNGSAFGGRLLFDEPLARHTYYRIGGPADLVALPKTREDAYLLGRCVRETGVPFFFLGLGSNLLASDAGFRGVIVKTGNLNLELSCSGTRLKTGVSVAVSSLLRRAAQEGWGGLEFLSGIPGSIGGAVFMNGGTHLGETKSRLRRVVALNFFDGSETVFEGEDLAFEYRHNKFLRPDQLVYEAEWEITPGDPAAVKAVLDGTLARRKATQPLEYPSCGSVFKNPRAHGMEAWQVVEKLGLRGHRIGGAQISEKHSNWIVNLGGATAADVRALIELVKSRSRAELGVPIEEEVRYLGAWD